MNSKSLKVLCLWSLSLIVLGIADFTPPETAQPPAHELPVPRRIAVTEKIQRMHRVHPRVSPLPFKRKLTNPQIAVPAPSSSNVLSIRRLEDKKRPTALTTHSPMSESSLDQVAVPDAPPAIQDRPETPSNFLGEITIQAHSSGASSDKPEIALNRP